MLIYKYKALSPLEHVLDVIVHQRLFCAPYEQLNDPFEGQFQTTLSVPIFFTAGSGVGEPLQRWKANKAIPDLPVQTQKTRVCSLSSSSSDVRLWSLYADGHKGVAFEFDFSGIEDTVTAVKYTATLPEFGTTILGGAFPEEVLTCKTDHWEYEKEYRIIGAEPYFSVSGRLKRVIAGHRASEELLDLIRKVSPPDIIIIRAKLDHDGVKVNT